jgi:hypothetical protein
MLQSHPLPDHDVVIHSALQSKEQQLEVVLHAEFVYCFDKRIGNINARRRRAPHAWPPSLGRRPAQEAAQEPLSQRR